jgi:hypothetical protein
VGAIIATPGGSADLLSALPSLPNGNFTGEVSTLVNLGTAEMVLYDNSNLNGSLLYLKSNALTLEPQDSVTLLWNGSAWYEIGRSASSAEEVNAWDFGLRETATGAQNNTAMALAIAAAQSAGKELHIPEGTFKLNMHGLSTPGGYAVPSAVPITASVVMRGAGAGKTIFVADGWVEPTYSDPSTIAVQNDNATAMFYLHAVSGRDVKMYDMTLRGPTEAELTHLDSNVWGVYAGGGGSLYHHGVDFENFCQSIKFSPNYPSYPGAGDRFTRVNCYDQFRGVGVLHGGFCRHVTFNTQTVNFTVGKVVTGSTSGAKGTIVSQTDAGTTGDLTLKLVTGAFAAGETITDTAGGSAKVTATYGGGAYHDGLLNRHRYQSELTNLISQLPDASAARHCLYISNGVSLRTVQCSFLASGGTGGEGGYGWRHHSVSDQDVPEYSESIGDYFAKECASALNTNPQFPSKIIGCTVHTDTGNGAVEMSDTTYFSGGCHFIGRPGALYGVTDGSFVGGRAIMSDTVFEGDFLYAMDRVNDAADRWTVGPNVEFNNTSGGGGGGLRVVGGGVDLNGVVLNTQVGTVGGSIFVQGGSLKMSNTRHTPGCKYMVIGPSAADATVEYGPGNTWDDGGSAPFIVPAAHNITIKGEASFYESVAGLGDGFQISGVPGATLSGSLRCGQGVGSYSYASNVLTIGWNKNLYPINEGGTPTIKTIAMKGSSASGAVAADHIKAGAPRFVLLAQQAFSLDNTGNIVLAASPLSVAANTTVELQWVPALAKFYVV